MSSASAVPTARPAPDIVPDAPEIAAQIIISKAIEPSPLSQRRFSERRAAFVNFSLIFNSISSFYAILNTGGAAFGPCTNRNCSTADGAHPPKDTQIASEIDYFLDYYGSLHPTVFLSYEREAYYANDGGDFRVTFDDTILCRQDDLSLESDAYGTPILPEGTVLMELKCSGGIPLWMTHVLSEEKLYKTSFSKYGTAYRMLIFPKTHKTNPYHMLEVANHA